MSDAPLHRRLARQSPSDIRLGLERMRLVLAALGAPERRLPPVIHVAGTNGKGSVIAFLKAMLSASGLRVHRFTSPALVHAGEQIECAGTALSDDALEGLVSEADAAAPEPLTPFESLTAAAFLAFARTPADIALIETGMGGRLDATNVVDRPALTLITPIAQDHTQFLGASLKLIANAKAGVFKPSVPAIVGPQDPEAMAVLEAVAAHVGAPLSRHGQDWLAFEERGRLVVQHDGGVLDLPLPGLAGRHQIDNAGTAIAAILALGGLGLDESTLARGLREARWPGRLERMTASPWLRRLPKNSDLWRDGAHNPHGARALAQFVRELGARDPKPLTLIVGLRADKDARAVFAELAPTRARVLTVPLPDDADSAAPNDLADAARAEGLTATPAQSADGAIGLLAREANAQRVVLCGSLSLMRLADV